MIPKRFYVYVLARPDGSPFYVGKGQGGRVYAHERYARQGRQDHKSRLIRKVWRAGGEISKTIVFETNDEHEAFAHERNLIALFGRETLCNLTDGGEGLSGLSEAMHQRLSAIQREQWQNPEVRARRSKGISTVMKARHADPVNRAAHAARAKERFANNPALLARHRAIHQDPELIARKQAARKVYYSDPANYAKLREQLREIAQRPERNAKISAALATRYQDPEQRAKRVALAIENMNRPEAQAKIVAARSDPDVQARKAAGNKAKWADPEYREGMRAKRRATWANPEHRARYEASRADPEYRAKQHEVQKAFWTPERRAAQAERMRERARKRKQQ